MNLTEEFKSAVDKRVENLKDENILWVKGQFDIYCDLWESKDPKIFYTREALIAECRKRGFIQ